MFPSVNGDYRAGFDSRAGNCSTIKVIVLVSTF
nr:MAG TPA: hypothetical protein [Caudoviricetes sp.]